MVDKCLVFLCILHYYMAMGRLQVAFVETRLEALPKENANALQQVFYRAPTGIHSAGFASMRVVVLEI